MDHRYDQYRKWIQNIIDSKSIASFKYSPNHEYNSIVEHRDSPWGEKFYILIKVEFGLSDEAILSFCRKNDEKGNAEVIQYSFGKCSANSIKYVYHAHLVLKYMQELQISSVNIVEIGGGYGGLAIAMLHYAPSFNIHIKQYNLIDLVEAVKLQELYLQDILGDISLFKFHDAMNFGSTVEGNDNFLIGVYSLGEFLENIQNEYIQTLFPKVSHGFLNWNGKPKDLHRECKRMTERPLTGEDNHFVYF
jgi:hypothetical protein